MLIAPDKPDDFTWRTKMSSALVQRERLLGANTERGMAYEMLLEPKKITMILPGKKK